LKDSIENESDENDKEFIKRFPSVPNTKLGSPIQLQKEKTKLVTGNTTTFKNKVAVLAS